MFNVELNVASFLSIGTITGEIYFVLVGAMGARSQRFLFLMYPRFSSGHCPRLRSPLFLRLRPLHEKHRRAQRLRNTIENRNDQRDQNDLKHFAIVRETDRNVKKSYEPSDSFRSKRFLLSLPLFPSLSLFLSLSLPPSLYHSSRLYRTV